MKIKMTLVERTIFKCQIEDLIERDHENILKIEYVPDVLYNSKMIQLPDLCAN